MSLFSVSEDVDGVLFLFFPLSLLLSYSPHLEKAEGIC